MKVEKIYHLADLHIRNLKRHTEYREVFQKFLNNVDRDNIENAVIYLAGDIAHAKTEMSPELVREISWFLTECANRKHTFLITGNHDCNLNNNYRLDVLTPIVENLENERIHYLRDTGVYPFHNITFVVYSILDNQENWPKGELVEGENTICLFHGPVNDSTTDIGYTVSSNSFTTEMFDGFDMVMLGDIHKRQTLGRSTIAYAGSMIQQNHGESLEKHGYLLWDVESRTFEEVDIPNDYGFYTLDVDNGVVPTVTNMPKKPRLRVRVSNTDPSQIKKALTKIKKQYKVQEFTVTRMDTLSKQKTGNFDDRLAIGNVRDVEFQNELIKDYLERQYLADDDTIDKIKQINREINTKLVEEEMTPNVQWVPHQFEFSNMFSYGENNKIRFDGINGIVGIFAPNASGKSSLFDALSFCIFDKTSRTYVAKNVLNNRKSNFYCKLHFKIEDVDYFIERRAKLINKGRNLKVDVSFWKEDESGIHSLNGEQRRDTNSIIQQYLGTYEDFVLTTLSLQGNNSLFIDKSQSERKEILAQFMGVDIFDKLYSHAYNENRDNASLIRKFKRDDFTQQLADIQIDLKRVEAEYKLEEVSLTTAKEEVDKHNQKLISLNEKIVKVKSDNYSKEELETKKSTSETSLTELISQRDKTQSKIGEFEETQIKLEEKIDSFDEEEITEGYDLFNKYTSDLKDLNNELDKLKIREDSLLERMKHLESHRYNKDCDICMENSESIIDAKVGVTADLSICSVNRKSMLKQKDVLLLAIDSRKRYSDLLKELNKLKADETKVSRDINILINKLSTFETKEIKLNGELIQATQLIKDYLDNEKQIKKNKELRDEIIDVRHKLGKSKQILSNSEADILVLNGSVSSLKNQKKTIEDRIDEVSKLEEQFGLYEYYLNALGKDGVSYELISKALPMIEGEVNNILGQIVEFGLQLEMDGKNVNANIVYDDQKWSLEMCSGMERFISGLAIRIALINVCNLPRPNFLVIDEGFGTLDNENLTSLYMLFAYLKTQFEFVMIISHIDSMRDVVDTLMEIKKVNGFSNIKF
jgi:energy-coupling factor transporter ATP-binding protein EcfA2/predicted MPP superfamily phosphohydrolase